MELAFVAGVFERQLQHRQPQVRLEVVLATEDVPECPAILRQQKCLL